MITKNEYNYIIEYLSDFIDKLDQKGEINLNVKDGYKGVIHEIGSLLRRIYYKDKISKAYLNYINHKIFMLLNQMGMYNYNVITSYYYFLNELKNVCEKVEFYEFFYIIDFLLEDDSFLVIEKCT